jgi:hypothetical protein
MNSRCEEFRTLMAAGGAESPEACTTEGIRRHLEECPDCREYLAALQADDALLAAFAERLRPSLSRLEDRVIASLDESSAAGRAESASPRRRTALAMLAAAAVLCIVAGLALRFFGWTGVASVGLARTLEAMQNQVWVHSVQAGPEGRSHECWQRWDGRVIATKSVDPRGMTIRYTDYANNVAHEYNRNSHKVTISFVANGPVFALEGTPLELATQFIEAAEKAGAKIRYLRAADDGANTETIRLDYPEGWPLMSMTMTRDTGTSLLMRMETTERQGGQEVVETVMLDYPDPGPADIYALGVPADATVYDTRPTGLVMDLVRRIQERFERGFGDHQAILLESAIENDVAYLPMQVSVYRQKGQRKRWDCYQAFNFRGLDLPYPGEEGRWPHLSMSQMFEIITSGAMKPVNQMLFDGSRTVTRQVVNGQARIHERRTDGFKAPWGGASFMPYLSSLAWPSLYHEIQAGSSSHRKMEVRELPADPNRPGWVGLRLVQSAERHDYWFDPARDDLLMERITVKERVSTRREFVKEVGQTSTGVWYPRVIEVETTNLGPDGVPGRPRREEKRILLESRLVIDDALFDPATLIR